VISLVKVIPVVSGLVGGGLDAAFTKAIANTAKQMFAPLEQLDDDPRTI
jgi:4-diphosphocytidyl-2C-methyl-D-erythritol kinase